MITIIGLFILFICLTFFIIMLCKTKHVVRKANIYGKTRYVIQRMTPLLPFLNEFFESKHMYIHYTKNICKAWTFHTEEEAKDYLRYEILDKPSKECFLEKKQQ